MIDIPSIRQVLENVPPAEHSPMHRILALHAKSLSIEYNSCAADLLMLATLATYQNHCSAAWHLLGCSEIRPGHPQRGESRPVVRMLTPIL